MVFAYASFLSPRYAYVTCLRTLSDHTRSRTCLVLTTASGGTRSAYLHTKGAIFGASMQGHVLYAPTLVLCHV
eukprot:3706109-Rhodomonas_salina.2